MKTNYRDNMNRVFRYLPNGLMHLVIVAFIPLYLIIGIFKGGLIEVMKEWWGEFWAKWEFSPSYKRKMKDR